MKLFGWSLASMLLTVGLAAAADDELPVYSNHRQLRVWRDAAGEHPVETPADWSRRRAHILAGMQQAMGKLPDRSQLGPLDIQITDRQVGPGFTRLSLSFAADEHDRVPCYLFLPQGSEGKRLPGILPPIRKNVAGCLSRRRSSRRGVNVWWGPSSKVSATIFSLVFA